MKNRIAIGLSVLGLCAAAEAAQACSSVFFDRNGQALLGHNMDWFADRLLIVVNKRHLQKHGFVFPNAPPFTWISKYGSISLVMEGREITGRGMNEAGLVILEMALADTQQSTDRNLPRLSVGQWAQYQLDTSASVEDVIASDRVVRISPEEEWQSQFLLWDSTGTLALVEWLDGKMVVFQGDRLPVPVFVNSAYETCLTAGDDPSGRFKKMSDRISAYDPAKDRDGVEFVSSVLQAGANMLQPPLRTLWQFVIDARAKRMYFSSFDNSKLRYVDLKDFDFSCQTQVEVLDLSRGEAGNVRSEFVPYTSSLNAELVRYIFGIYSSHGIPTSNELIEKIIAFPESTTCVDGAGGAATASGDAAAGDPRTSSSGRTGGVSTSDSSSQSGSHAQTSHGSSGPASRDVIPLGPPPWPSR